MTGHEDEPDEEDPPERDAPEDDATGDGIARDPDEVEEAPTEEVPASPFHEPEIEEKPGTAPVTPGTESSEIVDELRVEQEPLAPQEPPETGKDEPRLRRPHASELATELGLDPLEPVTRVPPVDEDRVEVLDVQTIRDGLAYVRMLREKETSRTYYQVIEPPLNHDEEHTFHFLRETLVQTLEGRTHADNGRWRSHLQTAVQEAIHHHGLDLSDVGQMRVHYYLARDFLGYGPIDVMMQDPRVEDISCDGPQIPLYVYHRDHESTRTNVLFDDEAKLDAFVRRLAQRCGKHISIAEPLLDGTLPDTSRLQATLAREITTRGSSFTIRRFRADPLTMPDLIRFGTLNPRMAAWYWIAMEAGSPMIIGGGTASGKTTTLSGLSQLIPPAKKVVSIEDTREFSLEHENWIASLTRSGSFGQEEGAIDMYELLRAALRQRPEYILVGEVRGEEAQTLFQAMATGHATYSTLHADSVKSAVHRLENRPIDVPRIMLQTLDAISVQTQVHVDGRTVRRITELTEITGIDDASGDLLTNQVYQWRPANDTFEYLGRSQVLDECRRMRNMTRREIEEEWSNRALVLSWMVVRGIRHIRDVTDVVQGYYARPERVLERVREDIEEAEIEEVET